MAIALYLGLVCPLFEYCIRFWALQYKKNIRILECVQRRATKPVKNTEVMSPVERTLVLSSLEKRKLRGEFILSSAFGGREAQEGPGLLSMEISNRMHGNCSKLHWETFRVDTKKKFFTMRVAKHWNKLPSEVLMPHDLNNMF